MKIKMIKNRAGDKIKSLLSQAIILCVCLACSVNSNAPPKDLIGHWKAFKKTTVSGDSLNWVGKPLYSNFDFIIEATGEFKDLSLNGDTYDLEIFRDTLRMKGLTYIIDTLTDEILILREFNTDYTDDSIYIHYLRKVDDK